MKKHLLPFALFLFLTTLTKAQTSVYHPFPDSNAYWNEHNAWSNDGMHFNTNEYSIFINGDTIIEGNTYHKLFESGYTIESYPPYQVFNYFNNSYEGAIRQDTSAR